MNFSKHIFFGLCIFLFACIDENLKIEPSRTEGKWISKQTRHFRLKAEEGVRSVQKLKELGDRLETFQEELLSLLKESENQKLEIYFLKDRETLTSYTGFPANGYTDTEKGIIYFVDKDPFHLPLKHELMHALSWRLWGYPKQLWISEGIAVFASSTCGGHDLHVLANALQKENRLVPFSSFTDSFDLRSLDPSLQAASLVKYIYETHGVQALKGFWRDGWKDAFQQVGKTPLELEKEWKDYIRQEKYDKPVDWNSIRASGCE